MPAIMLDVGALLIRVCRMLDRLCWLHMDVTDVTGHAQAGLNICTVVLVDRESPNPTQPLETQLGSWQSRLARRADVPRQYCAQRRPAAAHSGSRLNRINSASAGISWWTVAACTFRYSSAQAAGPDRPRKGCLTDQPATQHVFDQGFRSATASLVLSSRLSSSVRVVPCRDPSPKAASLGRGPLYAGANSP